MRARYVFANQDFGQPVRATEIEQLLRGVDGVSSAQVDLLAYTLADPGNVAQTLTPILAALPARIDDGSVLGAQILMLNPLVGGIRPTEDKS